MNAKLTASVAITDYESSEDYPAEFAQTIQFLQTLTNGTGDDKANRVFSDDRTLAASTSEDLDLAGGVETPFGETLTFTKVKAILIKATSTNGSTISVGGASATQFLGPFADATDILEIPADGCIMLIHPNAGWTVGAGTADLLKVANDDAAAAGSYTICIVGEGTVA